MSTQAELRLANIEALETELAIISHHTGRAYLLAREIQHQCIMTEEGDLHSSTLLGYMDAQCSTYHQRLSYFLRTIKLIKEHITSKETNRTLKL